MLSIYSSAFNLIENNFPYEKNIRKFCSFATEVVICVNKSSDNTLEVLRRLETELKNLFIFESEFEYYDILFDGKIKNEALSHCSYPYCIGLDLDEYIPEKQKDIWINIAMALEYNGYDALFIPVINLFKDRGHFFSIGKKWYLHKNNEDIMRGPWRGAIRSNGTIDVEKSDTCELIYKGSHELVRANSLFTVNSWEDLINRPFVVHEGYLDLDRKAEINKAVWKDHWNLRNGNTDHSVPSFTDRKQMERFYETKKHELQI